MYAYLVPAGALNKLDAAVVYYQMCFVNLSCKLQLSRLVQWIDIFDILHFYHCFCHRVITPFQCNKRQCNEYDRDCEEQKISRFKGEFHQTEYTIGKTIKKVLPKEDLEAK